MEPTTIIILVAACVITLVTFILGLAFSSNQYDDAELRSKKGEKSQIERGLKTACRLIERFYSDQSFHIKIIKATRGYQTATIVANVPARIDTGKIMRTRKDLEHYLLAHGIKLIGDSLKLEIGGTMCISWSKKADKEVYLSKVYRQYYAIRGNVRVSGIFPIGLDTNGNPFSIHLNKEESPHAMIVGSTGCGKTVCAMDIVIGALDQDWDVTILNPKVRPHERRLGLWDFKGFNGVTYIQNYDDMVTAMTRLSYSMDTLDRPVLIMADELADIIERMGKDIATPLGVISQKGREYDVHLVGITPKTTKSVLMDDMLHANSSTTIIGLRTNTKYLSQYGTGIGNMNLEKLAGNGHAMVRSGSTTTEVQVALPDNIESVRHNSGVVHEIEKDLLPIAELWLDSMPSGASASKAALRNYASAHGKGIGYGKVCQQFDLLVARGLIEQKGEFQAGVKI